MAYAHEYAKAVLHRGREGMPPYGFSPNWGDAPRQTKLYRGVEVLELPADVAGDATLADAFTNADGGKPFTVELLSDMLMQSYGRLARRVEINANDDLDKIQSYRSAKWARGTASGGGLYPVSIYWVAGPSAPVTPGVYYYSSPQHGVQRLLTGDVTGQVSATLSGVPGAEETDQFLLLGLKFWQNAFKYSSFSYHATTMDIGTVVETWRLWAKARGMQVRPAFWFDEQALGSILGVEPEDEGVFAVVPLRWEAGRAVSRATADAGSSVRHTDEERSKEVIRFEALAAIHADTTAEAADRPSSLSQAAVVPVARATVDLPTPRWGDGQLITALSGRRSSFGRFTGLAPMSKQELSTLLTAAAAGAALPCDVPGDGADGDMKLVRNYVFTNHVDGVESGVYAYDHEHNRLGLVKGGDYGAWLQRNYFLSNYNVEQAAAVIVPAIRGDAIIDVAGPRGYRVMNALIGSIAQAVYTASAGIGVGCGAALGFDNISYIEELGLETSGEMPLLILMLGHERGPSAGCRFDNR